VESAARRAPHAVGDVAGWAREAFAVLTDLPSVHRVGLALVEGGGRRLRFTASDRGGDGEPSWCDVDAYDDVPLNAAMRTGSPVIGALEDLDDRFAQFVDRQRGTPTVALAAVPVAGAGQTVGGFVLFFDHAQPFDRRQRRELTRLGQDLAAALRRARRDDRRRPALGATKEPVPAGALVAEHEVPADPAAVSAARGFLRRTLQDWGVGDDTADTATLCLSELVTNAVIHTHGGCVVRVTLGDGVLTTTVRDGGVAESAQVEPAQDPLQVHGRGLRVVEALASRWGYDLDPAGTAVWFALDVG
jgi:anti-sigma regulatory factor (Ser/Thr protein kinase)